MNIDNTNEFQGKFGRIFKDLAPAEFSEADLFQLAEAMKGDDKVEDGEATLPVGSRS